MSQPTYKFKWSNVDLNGYMRDRRFAAQQKRSDAVILVKEAEVIEAEMRALEQALVEVEDKDESEAKNSGSGS